MQNTINYISRKIFHSCLIFSLFQLSLKAEQNPTHLKDFNNFLPKVSVNKYGTLIGLQRGLHTNIELGVEMQKKQIKLINPQTFAVNALFEYSWKPNVGGLKVGAWYKDGRMGFTYGANILVTSNFTKYNLGFAPAIGFKVIGFHGIASYNIFVKQKDTFDYNTLNLSLRYYISRDRDFKIKKKN